MNVSAPQMPSRNRRCPCGSGRKYKLCCERTRAPDDLVFDLNIERAYVGFGADMSEYIANSDPGEKVIHVGELLAQIDIAWVTGRRTLLVSVDSGGGELQGGILLYDALQTFRQAGGHVVIFVSGLAASTMSWAILAADAIVAAPGSSIVVHGPSRGLPEAATDCKRALYRTGTLAPASLVEGWVTAPSGPEGEGSVKLPTRRALELGFVDYLSGYDQARALALGLARGGRVTSRRRKAIAARGELPEFAPELEGLHRAAMELRPTMRVEWDTRTPIGAAMADHLQQQRSRLAAASGRGQIEETRHDA